MEVIHGLENFPRQRVPVVVALGTFDGLHLGHQALLALALHRARGVLRARVSWLQMLDQVCDGRVAEASRLLGVWYAPRGAVVRGDGRERTLGNSSANLFMPTRKLIPALGINAGYARSAVGESQTA